MALRSSAWSGDARRSVVGHARRTSAEAGMSYDTSWFDLSDEELLARLQQRGLTEPKPELLVENRDDEDTARFISTFLGAE